MSESIGELNELEQAVYAAAFAATCVELTKQAFQREMDVVEMWEAKFHEPAIAAEIAVTILRRSRLRAETDGILAKMLPTTR